MPKSLYSFLKSLKKIFINELIAAEPQYKLIKFDNVSFKLDTTYKDYLVETLSGKNMNAWEKRERKISSILAVKSNIILDVGSNIGVYSILYSKLNPNSCIYAFEPYPINTTQLRKNVGLYNLTNVQIIEKAVGDISMPISFYIPSDDSTTTVTSANEAFTQVGI